MISLAAAVKAEWIRIRKDWPMAIAILAPICQVQFLFMLYWFSEDRVMQLGSGYRGWYIVNTTAWVYVFMPMGLAVSTWLSWQTDTQAQAWRHLLSLPVRRIHLLASRGILALLFTLGSQLLLAVLVLSTGWIFAAGAPELRMGTPMPGKFIVMTLLTWLATLPVLGFQLLLAQFRPGLPLTLGLAIAGVFGASQVANWGAWAYVFPWRAGMPIEEFLTPQGMNYLPWCIAVLGWSLLFCLLMRAAFLLTVRSRG